MAEKEIEVKTFRIHYYCDECEDGELLPTGMLLSSWPPQFPHACNKCAANKIFSDKRYPIILTRPTNN